MLVSALRTAVMRSVGDFREAGLKDAHHVIQDAAVRDLPGYRTNAAPGIQLPGPSTARSTPGERLRNPLSTSMVSVYVPIRQHASR